MHDERLESPADFAAQLAREIVGEGVPSAADIAALVDAAFYASLHEEELRRIELAIAWAPEAGACLPVVEIDPVRVTPRNLAKLAPATSLIAIRRDRAGLVAWALLERSDEPFTIRVLAPGILRVDHAGAARALYARGEIRFANRVASPAGQLARVFGGYAPTSPHAWDIERASIVTRIAERALGHGHGGMILVIPTNAEPVGVRVHYPIGDGANVLHDRRFTDAIELVARLTAVDNALLVDTDLRLRGFAVQVIEGDAPNRSFEHRNPYDDDVHTDDLSTFKGTRHPAGVIFCMRQPQPAAALIASQDGRLSLVTKDVAGRIEVLGSYERGFGWR
jgi:hypothetical protein